jgi:hypothetical protein
VTNLLSSVSDNSLVMRPDTNNFEEDIVGLSGKDNNVITQNFDDTLDILNSAAGLFGSERVVYFTSYVPFGYYDTNGEDQILSDTYTTGVAIGASGSYDVNLYRVAGGSQDVFITQKTWRGAVLEITSDGRYYLVDRITAASDTAETATVRLRAPLEAAYNGEVDLTSATYKWTASGSGTNEYYCEIAAGGDPSLTEPIQVNLAGSAATNGTVGSLNDHEWDWGDNDSLGYNTVYFRDDSGDPDVTAVDLDSWPGTTYALWYNHNPYRATDTKMVIQTGDSSTATAIMYCTPTFRDDFSAADICGPFYTNVTESTWNYSGITYRDYSATGTSPDQDYLSFATNGTTWMHIDTSLTPQSGSTVLYSTTNNIGSNDSWTDYTLADATWTIPQPSGDDVISGIAFKSVQRNTTRGYLCGCTVSATSVLGSDWTRPGAAWSSDNGASWTVVVDTNYDGTTGWIGQGAWDDGTTLTVIFRDSDDGANDDTINMRYSTDNGSTWANTTGVSSFNADGDKNVCKLKGAVDSSNEFVVCGGNDSFYYSANGQAFTRKDVGSDDSNFSSISDIAYNNGDGGTARWVLVSFDNSSSYIGRTDTNINGTYTDVSPSFSLAAGNLVSFMFYDIIGSRFITIDNGDFNGNSYAYFSTDYGANWKTINTKNWGATGIFPSNIDWSGQLMAFVFGGSPYEHTVIQRNYITTFDVDLFKPISDLYRATTFSILDGYTVLIGTSEWDASTEAFIYYPRRIRWTSPGTFNDFTSSGTGTADARGTGAFLYSLPINGRIITFETNTVGAIVPRGDTSDPWDYDVISDNFKILSNPVAVNDVAYVVGYDGLLYSCDGINAPEELGSSFDLTKFDDFDYNKPAWLIYSRELDSLICYYRDSSASTHFAQIINLGTGGITEWELFETGDSSAKSDQPVSVVAIEDANLRRTMASYHPNSTDDDTVTITKLSPGEIITGTDTITTRGTTYSSKWASTLESGELFITREGEKASVKHLIVETYTSAQEGDNSDRPWLVAEVKSLEDSAYATSGDSVGTATMTTSALTGASTTAWSSKIAGPTADGNTTQACDGATTDFTSVWQADQLRWYLDSTLQVSGTDYTTSGTTISFTSAPGATKTLYGYSENYPEVKVKVGDMFKSTEGWHRVTAINSAEDITLDHYLSTGSQTVTHYPAWQFGDSHDRIEIGINRLVEGVQIRLYLIPDYDGSNQSSIAKITGLSIGYVPQGRKIVKATGS